MQMKNMPIFRSIFRWAVIVAATGCILAGVCCCSTKKETSQVREVEKISFRRSDSLMSIMTARLDSPEITVLKLDSPACIVRIKATRAVASSHNKAILSEETRCDINRSSTAMVESRPATAVWYRSWWWKLFVFLLGAAFGWYCKFAK